MLRRIKQDLIWLCLNAWINNKIQIKSDWWIVTQNQMGHLKRDGVLYIFFVNFENIFASFRELLLLLMDVDTFCKLANN